jgi:hypothetical protein
MAETRDLTSQQSVIYPPCVVTSSLHKNTIVPVNRIEMRRKKCLAPALCNRANAFQQNNTHCGEERVCLTIRVIASLCSFTAAYRRVRVHVIGGKL